MVGFRNLLVAIVCVVPGAAVAGESQVNGAPLRYNYEYHCKGERIVIGRCRDNDDSSYCQVYYPDRPHQNGLMVQPVEMRGDVIAKLNACSVPAPQVATAKPSAPVPSAPARVPTGPSTPNAAKPPGLGEASWFLLDEDDEIATYFIKSQMTRSGNIAAGWFTEVYSEPRNFPEADIKGVVFAQTRYEADCARNAMKMMQTALFDEDEKQMKFFSYPDPEPDTYSGNELGVQKINIMCGKPQDLAMKEPLKGDGLSIAIFYVAMIQEMKDRHSRHPDH